MAMDTRKKLQLNRLLCEDDPSQINDTGWRYQMILLRLDNNRGTLLHDWFFDGKMETDPIEAWLDDQLDALEIAAVCTFYQKDYVLLLWADRQRFDASSESAIAQLISAVSNRWNDEICYVVSSVAIDTRQIYRTYRTAKMDLERMIFCEQHPRRMAPEILSEEAPLATAGKDTERRLFLKLVNMDFDGAHLCLEELIEEVGSPGYEDIDFLRIKLFSTLETAAYFLAFRAGKDQSMNDTAPHYLGSFRRATDRTALQRAAKTFIDEIESEYSPSSKTVSRHINQIIAFIHDHFMESTLNITEVAKQFHVLPQQLSRDFHKTLGATPSAYLQNIRLERAKQLLLDTDLTNEQIAEISGFGSVKRLYRAMQSSDGVTPGEYRAGRGTLLEETYPL